MVNNKKYSFSFTGASALIPETLTVAEIYNSNHEWNQTKKKIIDENLLNKIKAVTLEREFQEIRKRIAVLSQDQLNILCNGDREEVKVIILLSIYKIHSFIYDFAIEVLRNKLLQFDNTITESDYNKFVDSKSVIHPELNKLKETTLNKIKQRTFTILEQTGLINKVKDKILIKPVLSNACIKAIANDDVNYLNAFFISASEMKSLKSIHKSDYHKTGHTQNI